MYITLGLATAYTISSYSYNYFHKPKLSPAAIKWQLSSIINGLNPMIYEVLLSDDITMEDFILNIREIKEILYGANPVFLPQAFVNQCSNLRDYIKTFGIVTMQTALKAIIEREDLILPYLYPPSYQYLKSFIGLIGISEVTYEQFDNIKWFDKMLNSEPKYIISEKHAIDNISLLIAMGYDFSKLSGDAIHCIFMQKGELPSVEWSHSKNYFNPRGNIADFSKLDTKSDAIKCFDHFIPRNDEGSLSLDYIIDRYGIESIPLLKDMGTNFMKLGDLGNFEIHCIIDEEYGRNSIGLFKDAETDSSKLYADYIYAIIFAEGVDYTLLPKDAGTYFVSKADFSKSPGSQISYFIDKRNQGYIQWLKDVGENFTKLYIRDINQAIDNQELEILVSELGVNNICYLIQSYTQELTNLIIEAGAYIQILSESGQFNMNNSFIKNSKIEEIKDEELTTHNEEEFYSDKELPNDFYSWDNLL